ncbi:MAG: DNA primase [Deltaproteobacteria bacterium]|nr:MAG: DNA primase [Deltaproteobacteria bacterium]
MKKQADGTKTDSQSSLDFNLLLDRVEEAILEGKEREGCRKILGREGVWKKLGAEKQLKWARLAQMAGDIELALEILDHVNKHTPELENAWKEHIELLSILDRKKELVQVLARAKEYIGEEYHNYLKDTLISQDSQLVMEREKVFSPFDNLKERQAAIRKFLDLFSGREDRFARQWADRSEGKQGYVPVNRPISENDVEEHLSGRKTYGIYLLRSDSTVLVAVIDFDIFPEYRENPLKSSVRDTNRRERCYLFRRVSELSQELGLSPVIEFSGAKGYHFWYFFESAVPAGSIRGVLERIKREIANDLSAFHIEVFPKQDKLSGKGFGNLVKLPLGIHRLTGKRSYFLGCNERSTEAQLRYLYKIKKANPENVSFGGADAEKSRILVHPRMKRWAEDYPELMTLQVSCPPLGLIIASIRGGNPLSVREEKVLYQTIGFLPRARTLLHHLFSSSSDYNPHMVDYKLSRLRGKPLGCRRIHSLMNYIGDFCIFDKKEEYPHPLLHIDGWDSGSIVTSEKVKDLRSALENLKVAISRVEAFLK